MHFKTPGACETAQACTAAAAEDEAGEEDEFELDFEPEGPSLLLRPA